MKHRFLEVEPKEREIESCAAAAVVNQRPIKATPTATRALITHAHRLSIAKNLIINFTHLPLPMHASIP
jgi:hypothetical protein